MSGGGKSQDPVTIGFKYFFGIHMGIGRGPVDEIVAAKVADTMVWQGSIKENATTAINMPNAFGGEKKEGGIVGRFEVYMGAADQVIANTAEFSSIVGGGGLSSILTAGAIPGFRRMVTIFYDGYIAAMNPYPKKWSWRVRRAIKGWDGDPLRPDLAIIQLGAANPPPPIPSNTGTGSGIPATYDPPTRDPGSTVGETEQEHAIHRAYYDLAYRDLPEPKPPYDPDQGHVFQRPPETEDDYVARLTAYNSQFPNPGIKYYTYEEVADGDGSHIMVSVIGNYVDPASQEAPTVPPESLAPNGQIFAMNPAHIIYECLTNREWGRGFDRNILNTASFEACAETLKAEGFGLCMRWNRKSDIQSFVQTVVDHCAAVLYPERETALLTMKLIRGDYNKADLPLFNTGNGIIEIKDATASNSSSAINEIQVTYRDPVLNEDRIVKAQNLAAIQSSGGAINAQSKNYAGIPTGDLARRVAQRDLRSQVDGLRRFKVVMDRRGWKLTPGGVFRIQDAPRKIPDMVVRIATIEEGTLMNGQITLTVVEDVFSLPSTTFTQAEPSKWTPPNFNACVGLHEVFEVPYFLLNRTMSTANFNTLDNNSAFFGVVAERGQPANTNYDLAVKIGAPNSTENPLNSAAYCGYVP